MKNTYNFKNDFAILKDSPMAYLDSAATAQKPDVVLDKIRGYYVSANANPHRGAYKLSVEATNALNRARATVARFLSAKQENEIIFTKNATESLNLLAYSYGLENVGAGDEIVITIMEHHSNLVPWQKVAKLKGATLKYLYIDENYQIPDKELEKITRKTKIVSVTAQSNVLGVKVDVKKIVEVAHRAGAVVICDLSQIVAHSKFDVQEADVDFATFSGHKIYGPMGIGVLYGKYDLLNKTSPFLMGGDMIEYVYEQETTFAELPNKFEAGTQNVSGAVGLASAIDYLEGIGFDTIEAVENEVVSYALKELSKLSFVDLLVPKDTTNHSGVISFNVKGVHPHDVASILDSKNVCIRSGNHCAQPLLRFLGLDSTCRVSVGIYNTKEDVDKLISALNVAYDTFKKYLKQN